MIRPPLSSSLLPVVFLWALFQPLVSHADEEKPIRHAPRVVEGLELDRYVGKWFEIARIPNRFQKKCVANTTAHYTLREDGSIAVVNRCQKDNGEFMDVAGIAKLAAGDNPARLEVSFVRLLGKQLFWGDYWVIGLGKDYEYAVVGHPERKYGWILARTPSLSDEVLSDIHALLLEQGYDPDRFELTAQDANKEPQP